MHFTRVRLSFWRAFQHGQFLLAKGAAYSSILTLFPALLAVAGILEASHQTEGFVRQIGAAIGWVLPPGPSSIAMNFLGDQTSSFPADWLSFHGDSSSRHRRDGFLDGRL